MVHKKIFLQTPLLGSVREHENKRKCIVGNFPLFLRYHYMNIIEKCRCGKEQK